MKAATIFGGSGPLLILTTYDSLTHPRFVEKLAEKGIESFIAYELDIKLVRGHYGKSFDSVMVDVKQTDDLRVLDYNGHSILNTFSFSESKPVYFERSTILANCRSRSIARSRNSLTRY